jgi:hypothetical protein
MLLIGGAKKLTAVFAETEVSIRHGSFPKAEVAR